MPNAPIQNSKSVITEMAEKCHGWVADDLSVEQVKSAIWAMMMQFNDNQLGHFERRFYDEMIAEMGGDNMENPRVEAQNQL